MDGTKAIYRGVYPSFAEAASAIPSGNRQGFDHPEVADHHQHLVGFVKPSDYPLFYWMQPLMLNVRKIFDLGGNLGISYFSCRKYLTFRDDLRWTVFDVPAVVELGRRQTDSTQAPHLSFTTEISDANGSDILLTSGTLQYLEHSLADLLAPLQDRPKHIFVNRVPFNDKPTYYTVQYNNSLQCPYRITNKDVFCNSLQALGYEQIDTWICSENWTTVRFRSNYCVQHYSGYYFRSRLRS